MVDGGFAYGYLFMSQHRDAPSAFKELLLKVRPKRILEIGTMHGGLTLLLMDVLNELELKDSIIKTYDINDQKFLKPLVDNNAYMQVITKNLFNDTYTDWANDSCKQEVLDYISQEGVTMVLCDGGCKKCEFNLITPLLKNNDIIMAHDYAPTNEYFEQNMKGKIWDWHEIQDSDIMKVSVEHNLEPYHQDLMQSVAWCCRRKF